MKALFMEQRINDIDDWLDDEYWHEKYLEDRHIPKHILDGLEYFRNQSDKELIKQYQEIKQEQTIYPWI